MSDLSGVAIAVVAESMREEPDMAVIQALLDDVPVGSLATLVGMVATLAAAVAGPSGRLVLQRTALEVAGDG